MILPACVSPPFGVICDKWRDLRRVEASFAPSAASDHHDLRGVAPGAHDAFEAGGADADPQVRAGGDAADGGFAAAEHAGVFPVWLDVGIADAALHLVHAIGAVGLVTRDGRSAQIPLSQAQIRGRGGRGQVGDARGAVGGEAAGIHDDRIAACHDIDVVAKVAQLALQFVPGDGGRDDIGAGAAGPSGELGEEGGSALCRRRRAAS